MNHKRPALRPLQPVAALLAAGMLFTVAVDVHGSHPQRESDFLPGPLSEQFRFKDWLYYPLHPLGPLADQQVVYDVCGAPLPAAWLGGVENWDSALSQWTFDAVVCTPGAADTRLSWEIDDECGAFPACGLPLGLTLHGSVHGDFSSYQISFDRTVYPDYTGPGGQVQIVAHEWGHSMSLAEHGPDTDCDAGSVMGTLFFRDDTPCFQGPSPSDVYSAECEVYGLGCDLDADGFPGKDEIHVVTNYLRSCGTDAWPADINNSGFSDTTDISLLTGEFGHAAPPAPVRYDIQPSGFVDTGDLVRMTGLFGKGCAEAPAVASIRMAATGFIGDGSSSRQIHVGFQPKFVIVKADHPTNGAAVMRSATMSAARNVTNAEQNQGISELNGTGFKVDLIGSAVNGKTNEAGKTYYWWAVGGDAVTTDTYMGNGTDNRAIASVGFRPEMLLVIRPDGIQTIWRTSSMGSEDYDFQVDPGETDRTKRLDASGFTVGMDSDVNQSGIMYHYVAFKQSPNLYVGRYQSFINGAPSGDNRNLPFPVMTFNPDLVHVKADGGLAAVWKVLALGGDASFYYPTAAKVPDRIQSLAPSAGQFQVGQNFEVNLQSGDQRYYFFALDAVP